MPAPLLISAALSKAARLIPSSLYPFLIGAALVPLVHHYITLHLELRDTHSALAKSGDDLEAVRTHLSSCSATLASANASFERYRATSTTVTAATDEKLKAVQARLRESQLRADRLARLPVPAAEDQCSATDALLNEALNVPR